MPVVAEGIASTIREIAPADVNLFPVSIEGVQGQYFILNVIARLPCVDEYRSAVVKWTADDARPDKIGHYRMISDLTIDAERVRGHHMFRIDDWEVALIVSEELKNALENAGLGISFELVSQ
jgi:hypothetical protein